MRPISSHGHFATEVVSTKLLQDEPFGEQNAETTPNIQLINKLQENDCVCTFWSLSPGLGQRFGYEVRKPNKAVSQVVETQTATSRKSNILVDLPSETRLPFFDRGRSIQPNDGTFYPCCSAIRHALFVREDVHGDGHPSLTMCTNGVRIMNHPLGSWNVTVRTLSQFLLKFEKTWRTEGRTEEISEAEWKCNGGNEQVTLKCFHKVMPTHIAERETWWALDLKAFY